MASLAEREGLRGKVQCIYIDPPYGIKFNSNFQWSTTSSKVADGNIRQITREPEQVKAFRDTWQDGIHSYLTYLRDRVTVARDLLAESDSMFVQIGDENVHRVRCVMDEVLGENNFITIVTVKKTAGLGKGQMAEVADFVLWYGKNRETTKRRLLFSEKEPESDAAYSLVKETVGSFRRVRPGESVATWDYLRFQILLAAGRTPSCVYPATVFGSIYQPTAGRSWSTNREGMQRLVSSDRVAQAGRTISYVRFVADNPVNPISNVWSDTASGSGMDKIYVVQTSSKVIERCMLMATDPGDLVVDPTCGSGTTAAVAEEWGRRWITIDTSRVALALARARVMGARHPFYVLADTDDGMRKQAEATGQPYIQKPTHGNVRQGFVYERVPHITLKSIANNSEIDVISEEHQPKVESALAALNKALRGHKTPFEVTTGGRAGEAVNFSAPENDTFAMPSGEVVPAFELVEWEVPCEAPDNWPKAAAKPFAEFWEVRIARQQAIDASIAAKAEFEHLYDKPYEDRKKVRVAGPFTVESLSPHRMLGVDENDDLIDPFKVAERGPTYGVGQQFDQMVLENLRVAGVQQKDRDDRIAFTSLQPWPGQRICAEGRYREGDAERRAGILIGPEFGTVGRPDLVEAAREAGDAGFDALIACAFNFEAHASEFSKLGRIPVLKARMNADLHMAGDLKTTDKGNLFVVFGEPDIEQIEGEDGSLRVRVKGVDVFDPSTGEVRSDNADGIACWLIDTDYNEESFFVRHAYFLGQNDPYSALKTTLKAEIDPDAWASLRSDTSRPFPKPASGRYAVKVINHLGDEVMKVFRV